MHLLFEPIWFSSFVNIICQCSSNTGSFLCAIPDADSASALVALLAFIFSIYTFIDQNRRNRKAVKETELLRQQTIRLEWYRDVVKQQMDGMAQKFAVAHAFKVEFKTSDLLPAEQDHLLQKYKATIFSIRDQHLEPILFIHRPIYEKLKKELDDLADVITNVISNDELKLTMPTVYEREIGSKIKNCQQRFYGVLYGYRGED
jgi:hypothetical protein